MRHLAARPWIHAHANSCKQMNPKSRLSTVNEH